MLYVGGYWLPCLNISEYVYLGYFILCSCFFNTLAGLFSEFALFIHQYLTWAIYLLSGAQRIIFPWTSTVIMVIFNTLRRTHNDPSHLHFCQSNFFLHMNHIRSFSPHIHHFLHSAFYAIVRCPTSTAVVHLSRNFEELQPSNRQLFLHLVLWARLEVDRMTGDMDTKLHPSHILEGISKISLLHVRLLVSKPQFFDIHFLRTLNNLCCQHHALACWHHP